MSKAWTIRVSTRLVGLVLLGFLGFALVGAFGYEYVTKQPAFCGENCHVMQEAYDTWRSDVHGSTGSEDSKQASCVDCHFAPGGKRTIRAQFRGLRHLSAYYYDKNAPLPINAEISDLGCLQSGCHEKTALAEKELVYADGVRFTHDVHLSGEALAGAVLGCDACHAKVSADRHFEVPRETCFLCHFGAARKPGSDSGAPTDVVAVSVRSEAPVDFLEGRSRCELCHEIPTKPLQSQKSEGTTNENDKIITHQTLIEDGVACLSCHFEVVAGFGEVNAGNVMVEGCLECHRKGSGAVEAVAGARELHEKHVSTNRAVCFDCHREVRHGARQDHYQLARADCTGCHDRDQHRYQIMLLEGATVVDSTPGVPGLMHEVNTNCVGCHEKELQSNGHAVKTGSGEACARCHTADQGEMLEDWDETVRSEVEAVREIMEEARTAIEASQGGWPQQTRDEANRLFEDGVEIVRVVEYGNGVHNKKYAIMLIDEAFTRFEEVLDLQ